MTIEGGIAGWEGTPGPRTEIEVRFAASLPVRWWRDLTGALGHVAGAFTRSRPDSRGCGRTNTPAFGRGVASGVEVPACCGSDSLGGAAARDDERHDAEHCEDADAITAVEISLR